MFALLYTRNIHFNRCSVQTQFFFCWCHNCLTALCYDWKRLLFYNIFKKIMTTWQAFMLITYCKMLNRKNILSLPISMKDIIILWHQQNNGKKNLKLKQKTPKMTRIAKNNQIPTTLKHGLVIHIWLCQQFILIF